MASGRAKCWVSHVRHTASSLRALDVGMRCSTCRTFNAHFLCSSILNTLINGTESVSQNGFMAVFSTAVRLKSTFPLCSCEPPCPNLNLPTICRSQLRSMRRFNAKSALNHLPRRQLAAPQQQAHCPPAKTALSDHGRQRYSLEKKREALELFNRGYGYKRASIVLGVPAYTVRDWNRLYKENRFLQSGSTLDTKSLWEETADEG